MRILGIIFYAVILTIVGATMIVYSFGSIQPQDISNALICAHNSMSSRIIFGLSGLLLILISFSFAQLILGRFQREKTIAFATAAGEVTIALSAVEDLIRRLAGMLPEIRELRPDVIATKKGILADLRVILKSEANIPELTARLQDITRSKLQEVLGIEEQISIRIHVIKIISSDHKDKKRKDTDAEEPAVPYGYRI